jgi:DNA-binding NarL/FixJ family response regulator
MLKLARFYPLAPRTIHNHVRTILRKLKTETRTGAALEATELLKQTRELPIRRQVE